MRLNRSILLIIILCLLAPGGAAAQSAPHIGNGRIGGIVSPDGLSMERLFLSTAHTDGTDGTDVSHIIPVTIPVGLSFPGQNLKVVSQVILHRQGVVATSLQSRDIEVECRLSASRAIPGALVAEVTVEALRHADILCVNTPSIPSSLAVASTGSRRVWCEDGGVALYNTLAIYNKGADCIATSSVILPGADATLVGADTLRISLAKGAKTQFAVIGTVISSADFPNPASHAERQAIYAHTVGISTLADRHRKAWDELWQSDIIIEGDSALQQQVTMALYSLYSAILPGSRQSIAPMGLTSDHYGGHIFWDADTWMLPVLCILHPEAARDMIDYRADRLPQARANALAMGYRGAMYPWESDLRGNEATPTFALTGPLEHHVTADVARGAWLYFLTSADTAWLREYGEPMIRACADFWVSRAEANPDGSYSIRGVVGADEYAINVDDNAFTNAAAIRNLQYAAEAAAITGRPADEKWLSVAEGLRLHRLPSRVIAEYEGFADTTIKQADVALLAYPLGFITDRDETDRTLLYYEALTDSVGGPAMSHSAMAVNYARLGQPDKAASLIDRATTPYLRGPHLMMAETPSTDDTYFLTGAGGLLQAILMGYLGLDITEGGIRQSSASLPSGIRKITAVTPHGTFTRSATNFCK